MKGTLKTNHNMELVFTELTKVIKEIETEAAEKNSYLEILSDLIGRVVKMIEKETLQRQLTRIREQ